jgi:uncharacterized protein GlcG (DUF336 family)
MSTGRATNTRTAAGSKMRNHDFGWEHHYMGGMTIQYTVTSRKGSESELAKVTLEAAKYMLSGAERRAAQLGLSEDIAIVDDGGHLVAFIRMDEARIAGIDIAINKAWTAATMKMPTANLAQSAQPGGPTYGINTTNQGRIVILGGGIPLMREGKVVGAVGVSGASSAQDIEVANAAVQVWESLATASNAQTPKPRMGTSGQLG